jgi:hypothetical protein
MTDADRLDHLESRICALEAELERRQAASRRANAAKSEIVRRRREQVRSLGLKYGWPDRRRRLTDDAIIQRIRDDLADAHGCGPGPTTIRGDLLATLGRPTREAQAGDMRASAAE